MMSFVNLCAWLINTELRNKQLASTCFSSISHHSLTVTCQFCLWFKKLWCTIILACLNFVFNILPADFWSICNIWCLIGFGLFSFANTQNEIVKSIRMGIYKRRNLCMKKGVQDMKKSWGLCVSIRWSFRDCFGPSSMENSLRVLAGFSTVILFDLGIQGNLKYLFRLE